MLPPDAMHWLSVKFKAVKLPEGVQMYTYTLLQDSLLDPALEQYLGCTQPLLQGWAPACQKLGWQLSLSCLADQPVIACRILYLRLTVDSSLLTAQSLDAAKQASDRDAFSLRQLLWLLLSCHIVLWLQRTTKLDPMLLHWLRGLQVCSMT